MKTARLILAVGSIGILVYGRVMPHLSKESGLFFFTGMTVTATVMLLSDMWRKK